MGARPCKQLAAMMCQEILKWFRHVIRMNQTRVDNTIFERKPKGRIKIMRKAKLRWLEDGQNDYKCQT
jgi:hypothetical protein